MVVLFQLNSFQIRPKALGSPLKMGGGVLARSVRSSAVPCLQSFPLLYFYKPQVNACDV